MSTRKKPDQQTAPRFVDLEAQVDDEDVDDEEELYDGNFIDDANHYVQPSRSSSPLQYGCWDALEKRNETPYDETIRYWQQRARGAGGSSRNNTATPDELLGHREKHRNESVWARGPMGNDYPLWRIRCRPGLEEAAVIYLSKKATSCHQLRSAFMRSSTFRGWIYIEAHMNDELGKLLKSTPGLIHGYPDVSRNQVDFGDWTKVLTMVDSTRDLGIGKWVRVRSGLYKGDIGFLEDIETWGGASILLIPRLHPHNQRQSPRKRKRPSGRPMPALFDANTVVPTNPVRPVRRDDGCFYYLGSRFHHGLVYKVYNKHTVVPVSEITLEALQLFKASQHPELTGFPPPAEWTFEEGEKVSIISTHKQGVITSAQADSVEVDLDNGEGLVPSSRTDLRKIFQTGDFVNIVRGFEAGKAGWVLKTEDDWIEVLGDLPLQQTLDQSNQTTKAWSIHANRVRLTTPPKLHPSQEQTKPLPLGDNIPWRNLPVLITQKAHPMKGHSAVIVDVLCGQQTCSGLQVVIQYTHHDVANPMRRETIDYDNVVHATFLRKLFDVQRPKGPNRERFEPANCDSTSAPPIMSVLPDVLTTAMGTPLPDFSPAWTPAWDPSSRTPLLPSQPLSLDTAHPTTQHVLLNPLLMGKRMKVLMNTHSPSKEIVVSLVEADGSLSLRTTRYKKSELIAPQSISPKHPNATRDNGLLTVIRGEHCGKYVRRLYHRYGDSAEELIMLAVIEGVENGLQGLSQERFDLDRSHLCLCDETKADRHVGNALMKEVREETRRRRGM